MVQQESATCVFRIPKGETAPGSYKTLFCLLLYLRHVFVPGFWKYPATPRRERCFTEVKSLVEALVNGLPERSTYTPVWGSELSSIPKTNPPQLARCLRSDYQIHTNNYYTSSHTGVLEEVGVPSYSTHWMGLKPPPRACDSWDPKLPDLAHGSRVLTWRPTHH